MMLKKRTFWIVVDGWAFDTAKVRCSAKSLVVVLTFYVPPTAKVMWRRDGFKVSSERLEKPGIELRTPGLQSE